MAIRHAVDCANRRETSEKRLGIKLRAFSQPPRRLGLRASRWDAWLARVPHCCLVMATCLITIQAERVGRLTAAEHGTTRNHALDSYSDVL